MTDSEQNDTMTTTEDGSSPASDAAGVMPVSQSDILATLIRTIPYPNQIEDIDLDSENNAVRFSWRRSRYRISERLSVEEVGKGVLKGSNETLLLEELLNRELVS